MSKIACMEANLGTGTCSLSILNQEPRNIQNPCCHSLCPSKLCLLCFLLQGQLCSVLLCFVCCTSTAGAGLGLLLARTHRQRERLGLQVPAVPHSGSWGTITSPSWPALAAAARWGPETCPCHEHSQCSQPNKAINSQGFVSRFPCLSP